MTKIKIITVKGNSPEERANLIEDAQNLNETIICKGSVYYEYQNLCYADIFFIQGDTEIKKINSQGTEKTGEKKEVSPDTSNLKKLISDKQFNLLKMLHKELDMPFKVTRNWKSYQASKKIKELNNIKKSYMN